MRGLVLVLAISVFWFLGSGYVFAQESNQTPKILISELKIDGSSNSEYATLFNISDQSIDISGWSFEYAKPGFDTTNCSASNWSTFVNGYSLLLPENTVLDPGKSVNVSRSMTDSYGGSVRIVDKTSAVHDLLGWDNGSSMAPCLDNQLVRNPAPWAGDNQSIQRVFGCEDLLPVDTDNNAEDFILSNSPGTFTNNCNTDNPTNDSSGSDEENNVPSNTTSSNKCEGLIINELLPNPEGSDGGFEFIELTNPTSSSISLEGCSLQTSANSNKYAFGQITLKSGEFKAFYNSLTSLTLPNSSGGTVWLIDTDNTEIDQVDYPPDLDDNLSWSLFSGGFVQTYKITPNSSNELLKTKPCPAGQYRNAETNRCNNIVTASSSILVPCRPNQIRNSETNRCRNIASLSSVLKACAPDQFRNPTTNRCKKVSGSSLVPCKPGQERNPETNRCRNTTGVLSNQTNKSVQDIVAPPRSLSQNWLMAFASIIGAAGYAVFEWRNEIFLKLLAIRSKFA